MNLIPVKTPWIFKKVFPKYVWDLKGKNKVIYLTFDDGPTPDITEWTLDVLNQYNAKATFFCIGNNIEKHPEIFKRVVKEGHAIGNHTFNHPRGWKTKTDDYIDEVLKTQESIDSRIQNSRFKVENPKKSNQQSSIVNRKSSPDSYRDVNLFRPPYGQITSKQGRALMGLGYKIIMWDVLAFDWKDSLSNEGCSQNVISKSGPGSIIVFHDSLKAAERMQYALPKVLDYFSQKGFEFKRIPE